MWNLEKWCRRTYLQSRDRDRDIVNKCMDTKGRSVRWDELGDWGWHPHTTTTAVASVVSDSVRPHRWQPTRLPHPWDSPSKNTGVGCHFLLQCMKVKSESEVTRSCLTLINPMDCSPPGSSAHGIFQARVLEWGAIAFSISRQCQMYCLMMLEDHCLITLKKNLPLTREMLVCPFYR